MSGDNAEYEELGIQMKINTFEALRDEEALDDVIWKIQEHPDYDQWLDQQIRSLMLAYPNDVEESTEKFRTLFKGFTWRFKTFFNEEDAFYEVQQKLVERETQGFQNAHENVLRVLDGEEPEEVYDSTTSIVKMKTALEESEAEI